MHSLKEELVKHLNERTAVETSVNNKGEKLQNIDLSSNNVSVDTSQHRLKYGVIRFDIKHLGNLFSAFFGSIDDGTTPFARVIDALTIGLESGNSITVSRAF